VLCGVGELGHVNETVIRWPSQRVTAIGPLETGRELRIVEPATE
jgi:hypothetical protein